MSKIADTEVLPSPTQQPPLKPAAEPPAPPEERKLPEMNAEQLEEQTRRITETMFAPPGGVPKPEKKAEPTADKIIDPPDKPVEPEPKKKDETPPPDPKKDEKAKPVPPPIRDAIKPDQLQAPKQPKQDVPDELTDEDDETIAALARMEKDGKAPVGIVAKTKAFWDAEQKYIAKWTKDNPGHKYDLNDEAHATFYDDHEPAYDERELTKAKRAILEETIEQRVTSKVSQKNEKENFERDLRDRKPYTARAVHESMVDMIAEAGFKDALTKDGKLVLNKETEDAIDAESPHARDILLEEAEVLNIQVEEIDKLQAFPGKYQWQPNLSKKTKNGTVLLPHQMIYEYGAELEGMLAAMPAEQSVRDGKRFVTNADFSSEVNRILESPASQEAKRSAMQHLDAHYYTIGPDDIKAALIVKHAHRAKAKIEKFGGVKKKEAAPAQAETTPPPKKEEPQVPAPSSRAPSVSSASDSVDTGKKPASTSINTQEQVERSMWGN